MSCHLFVSTTRDGRTNHTINTRDQNDGKYHQITCTGSVLPLRWRLLSDKPNARNRQQRDQAAILIIATEVAVVEAIAPAETTANTLVSVAGPVTIIAAPIPIGFLVGKHQSAGKQRNDGNRHFFPDDILSFFNSELRRTAHAEETQRDVILFHYAHANVKICARLHTCRAAQRIETGRYSCGAADDRFVKCQLEDGQGAGTYSAPSLLAGADEVTK
jgi:hypothetical protein